MRITCGCGRLATYEVYTGTRWQPHCKSCAEEAMDCKEGALIRRIDELADGDSDKGKG